MPQRKLSSENVPSIVSREKFQKLLKLNYNSFDQLPAGGWREYDIDPYRLEAAKLIDIYHLHNYESLKEYQHRVLFWHAGQLYAFEGLNDLALNHFKKSYDLHPEPNDTFKWNSYVKGTIAFLERDTAKLIEARDELRVANKIEANGNLKFIESFVRCFDKTYREAYDPACK